MLRPCNFCLISKKTSVDLYGQESHLPAVSERCSIVKCRKYEQHTTVRADSSSSRGFANEFLSQNKILLLPATIASFDDKLTVANIVIRVTSLTPMYDVWGKLDHYELVGESWE